MQLAKDFGIKEYPSPAGGCLLTDKIFSDRLRDLMYVQKDFKKTELYLLKHGRHFRLDSKTKAIVGRSKDDNTNLLKYFDKTRDIVLNHAKMPGPDVILTGNLTRKNIKTSARICASYTKSKKGEKTDIKIITNTTENIVQVETGKTAEFKHLMI